jgi:hypothetical protein
MLPVRADARTHAPTHAPSHAPSHARKHARRPHQENLQGLSRLLEVLKSLAEDGEGCSGLRSSTEYLDFESCRFLKIVRSKGLIVTFSHIHTMYFDHIYPPSYFFLLHLQQSPPFIFMCSPT